MKTGFFLYVRLALQLISVFFVTRFLIEFLGKEAFGIYTVLLSVTTICMFLQQAVNYSLQRQFSVCISTNSFENFSRDFLSGMVLSFGSTLVSAIIAIVMWEFGFFEIMDTGSIDVFVIRKTFLAMISWGLLMSLTIPIGAALIAFGRYEAYSYLGLLDSGSKIVCAYLLSYVVTERVFVYVVLLNFLGLIYLIAHIIVIYKSLVELVDIREWKPQRELLTMSFWNGVGILAGNLNVHANNVLVNLFFGVHVNADRAVSSQIGSTIQQLGSQMFLYFRPKLIASFFSDRANYRNDVVRISRLSQYSILLFAGPLLCIVRPFLNLWLGYSTEELVVFIELTVLGVVLLNMHNPITATIHAIGKMSTYSILVESIILLSFPLSYALFVLGFNALSTFVVSIILIFIAHLMRILVLVKYDIGVSVKEMINLILIPSLIPLILVMGLSYCVNHIFEFEWSRILTIAVGLLSLFVTGVAIWVFGLTKNERRRFLSLLR